MKTSPKYFHLAVGP